MTTSTLHSGERQVAPDVTGIRRDHVARYEFALGLLAPASRVLDLACGVGYGTDMLSVAGHKATGIDRNADTIAYANEHYRGNGAMFIQGDAETLNYEENQFDACVCFETLEHLADPRALLERLHDAAPTLICSVPNEDRFPYRGQRFHMRHYTKAAFRDLLLSAGWHVTEWHGQEGIESAVEKDVAGRTMVAVCRRGVPETVAPEHVSIVGLGPSMSYFIELTKRLGGKSAYCNEVWGLNAVGNVLSCDRVFHMDDLRIQELRAARNPKGNIAAMVRWLRKYPGPVYTSVIRKGYPGLVPFPLEAVLNARHDGNGGAPYFNSTAAYAIAYAIHIGVRQISLFGIDYTLENAHRAEQGRACCEFWLGIAAARGIEITVPSATSLMDACASDRDRLYGYDCVDVTLHDQEDGSVKVEMKARERIPTAEEIEARYDHSKHPNRLMQGDKEPTQ